MNNSLDLYKIFQKVADEKSFSSAAKKLFISQPAVSQSIKQLEDNLGIRLFLRSSKGVSLTDSGNKLYGYVQSALGLLTAGETRLLKERELRYGELTIAAGDTLTKHFLLYYISKFHQLYPQIAIHLVNRISTQSIALLQSGAADLAFVNLPIEAPLAEFIPCFKIHDVFVANKNFLHLKDKPLKLEELERLPLLMLETESNSRRQIDQFLLTKSIRLSPEIELGSHDLLTDFASVGMGVASVVREFAKDALAKGELFELLLTEPLPARDIAVGYLREIPLSSPAEKFLEMIFEEKHADSKHKNITA